MPVAHAGDVRIRIHHLGGTGPPLLCVHATGFHGRIWEPFVPPLREYFSCISFDQRGHGDSDKPATGYEWDHFGEDTLAVIDELGLDRPVAIGHSAGGAALVLAETMRPGTFSKLVLMDPVTPQPELSQYMASDENPMAEQARKRRAIWSGADEMVERLKRGTPMSDWKEEFLRAYVVYGTEAREDGTVELKCPPEVEAQVYLMGGKHNGWDKLAEVECPVLVLTGSDSYMWLQDRAAEAGARPRNGRHESVKGGHFFPMENPEETAAATLNFLLEK